MSNFRYATANIKKIRRRAMAQGTPGASKKIPRKANGTTITRVGATPQPIGFRGRKNEFDEWRKGLGEPVTKIK